MKEKKSESMKSIKINDNRIFIFGTIKGLKSEEEDIKKAYERVKPKAVAISISEEEMKGLGAIAKGEKHDFFLSNYEEVYARKLAGYINESDKVIVPPPSFLEAYKIGFEKELPIIAMDMNEEEYSKAYCENISSFELIRHSTRIKRLKKKRFKAKTPEEFVKEWDITISKIKGFKNLETKREEFMAQKLIELSKDYNKILAVIDIQRVEGIFREISESYPQ